MKTFLIHYFYPTNLGDFIIKAESWEEANKIFKGYLAAKGIEITSSHSSIIELSDKVTCLGTTIKL